MRPRQETIDLFSTFVRFEGDRVSGWMSDARLRRSMQRCVEQLSKSKTAPTSEPFWALYWHQHWVKEESRLHSLAASLSVGHLSAYLQEPCYWAADQTVRKFTSVQYGLSDYFQMAMADLRSVLKRFNPDRGANLKTFATIAFSRLLKDQLRQRQEVNFCTNLGLLRRVSKKRLLDALRQAGLSPTAIAQYQLAWMCFNALYVQTSTGTNHLPAVDRPLWIAIANLYNTEQRKQLVPSGTDCTPETIERWLNQCATWVRAYLYPPVESLNVPKAGLELGGEIQDDLADPFQESLLAELVAQEERQDRREQRSQLRQLILTGLEKLDAQSQGLLRLYYQQGLTQQQIMQQLQMSQATVSRRLTKTREALLMALVQWSQETVNNPPTPNLIKDMSAALDEWLGVHYGVSDGVPNPDSGSKTAGKETER
ncbi:MAG: sigma-70 family RNA polymerase sigma factor [Leptolyngbyaceae cyanobacterium RU_5_1]|nr:sigma-70 family RNA polymerase sigma factor [Leptolyngbyaceae cyanobacterium RU_5_1]